MTDLEFKILSVVLSSGSPQWSAVVNLLIPTNKPSTVNSTLRCLMYEQKWICRTGGAAEPPFCYIRLTDDGEIALQAEEEQRKKLELAVQQQIQKEQAAKEENKRVIEAEESRHEKERKSDRRFQIFLAFLNAFLSFTAGLLAEHYIGIFQWILSLIK